MTIPVYEPHISQQDYEKCLNERVVRVVDLIAYIEEKMPRHTGFMGDYAKGKEDILDDIKEQIENH